MHIDLFVSLTLTRERLRTTGLQAMLTSPLTVLLLIQVAHCSFLHGNLANSPSHGTAGPSSFRSGLQDSIIFHFPTHQLTSVQHSSPQVESHAFNNKNHKTVCVSYQRTKLNKGPVPASIIVYTVAVSQTKKKTQNVASEMNIFT